MRGWLDTGWMLIALFAVLGVDLVVIMVLVGVLARRRWVSDEPGAFGGAIRITGGGVPGLGTRWMRGYGRWVREILVWARAPFLFRNELVVADAAAGAARAVKPGEVGRVESMPRLWCWPSAVARGSRLLLRQMGVSERPGRSRWGGR